jgi:hypothetical protein
MKTTRTPIKYSRAWAWLLTIVGAPRRFADIRVGDDRVRVRMGWFFRARFRRSDVATVVPARAHVSIGAHGWKGRWLVNGAHRPIAAIELTAAVPARVLGFPIELRELLVSVDDVALLERLLLSRVG